MPDLSILLPHKNETENNKALSVALQCIAANTIVDYELLIDATTPADPYECLNALVDMARSEWVFFTNSDIFVAPGWDVAMFQSLIALGSTAKDTMITVTLVESGAIGVHHQNIQRNFGMTPDTFDRPAFESYCATTPAPPDGPGFYYYHLIHRPTFIECGKFHLGDGRFPTPLDSQHWERWLAAGRSIRRAHGAYVYHLQNYSNPTEQQKAARHVR